ncbi:MAG: hypothetical protein QOG67_3717 [Verrucomicrobiota bacterium]
MRWGQLVSLHRFLALPAEFGEIPFQFCIQPVFVEAARFAIYGHLHRFEARRVGVLQKVIYPASCSGELAEKS